MEEDSFDVLNQRYVPEHRRINFKNKERFNNTEIKRRRDNTHLTLRRRQTQEKLAKRRISESQEGNLSPKNDSEDENENSDRGNESHQFIINLPQLKRKIESNDLQENLQALIKLKNYLLTDESNNGKIIEDRVKLIAGNLIEYNILMKSVDFLQFNTPPLLREEALKILINITIGSSEIIQYLIDLNIIPKLIQLIQNVDVEEDAKINSLNVLGNISGDNLEFKYIVIEEGLLPILIDILSITENYSLQFTRFAAWVISNLCEVYNEKKRSSCMEEVMVRRLLYSLRNVLKYNDEEIHIQVGHSLKQFIHQPEIFARYIQEYCIIERLLDIIDSSTAMSSIFLSQSLEVLIKNIYNNNTDIDYLNNIFVPWFNKVLGSEKDSKVLAQHCRLLEFFVEGNSNQQLFLDSGLISILIEITDVRKDFTFQKIFCDIIFSFTSQEKMLKQIINFLVQHNAIPLLCNLLKMDDQTILVQTLDILNRVLNIGEIEKVKNKNSLNTNAILIINEGGYNEIVKICYNQNELISRRAESLIEIYFKDQDFN